MKKRFSLATVSILFVVALLMGCSSITSSPAITFSKGLTKIRDVLSLAEKNYVDEIDTPKLIDAAINAC